MRKPTILFSFVSAVLMFSFMSCKPLDQEREVKVETGALGEVGVNFALVNGKVIDTGEGEIEQHGFCYSKSKDPTIFDHISKLGSRTTVGDFSDSLLNLQSGTTYYVCAFAQANDETFYGDQTSFVTLSPTSPEVNIESVGEVEGDTLKVTSIVIDDGGSDITARGVCWNLEQNPTLADAFTSDGNGTGTYNSTITGLMSDTVYYIRAYATSSVATSYSDQLQVSTPSGSMNITTQIISEITMNSAVSGGNILDDGGSDITTRGVCWSNLEHPTVEDTKTEDGSGSGSFTSSITGLSPETMYYVRAYATNGQGTSYGNEVSFTTSKVIELATVTTENVSSITESAALSGGNITDDGGSAVTARGVCWSTSQGPDLTGSYSSDGLGDGSYTSSLTELSPNTLYYVRAYATNGEGTAYGNELSFTTSSSPVLPTVTTAAVHSIATNSAKSGGDISDDGGSTVLTRGVCWNTTQNPDLQDNYTTDGGGIGSYTSTISGLDPNTVYYLRAYATNGAGTAYGNEVSFTTTAIGETITDYEGNVYKTVEIGSQTWMAENLKATTFSNGDPIDQLSDVLDWVGATIPGYCYYENDISYNETYGAIYNFYVVEDSRGVCPSGWHVPTETEWEDLIEYAGGFDVAGAKLKEVGTEHWATGNYATDEFGFTALPGGSRMDHNAAFGSLSIWAYFWSSTLNYTDYAYYYGMGSGGYSVTKNYWYWTRGYSIRCIKD